MLRMHVFTPITLAALVFFSAHSSADEYHLTAAEKAACTGDAERLCANTYPDENKLLACMEANERALSANCDAVFKAGVKRRHLASKTSSPLQGTR